MAGYREFQTGEVLTAANVDDFLAKQAVMKFADSAARDTALGTAVGGGNALREGMVAYLDSTDEVQYFDGSVWGPVGAEPPAGIGSNVVQAVKTDTFTTASSSYTNITGLSATITPTSASSKILLLAQVNITQQNGAGAGGYALRFSGGNSTSYVGNTAGSRITSATGIYFTNHFGGDTTIINWSSGVMIYVDSPATTSATTYTVQTRRATAGTVYVNRGLRDSDTAVDQRAASSLTVIEVAA